MAGRIDVTVFWPGIHPDILRTKGSCMTCIREAPSQPAGFPVALPSPDYPFQMLVADFFSLHGHNFFLVIADRFTGWNAIVSPLPGIHLTSMTSAPSEPGQKVNKRAIVIFTYWKCTAQRHLGSATYNCTLPGSLIFYYKKVSWGSEIRHEK